MNKRIAHKPKITYLVNGVEVSRCIYLELKDVMRNFWRSTIIKYPKTVNNLPKSFRLLEFKMVVNEVQKEYVSDDTFLFIARKEYGSGK